MWWIYQVTIVTTSSLPSCDADYEDMVKIPYQRKGSSPVVRRRKLLHSCNRHNLDDFHHLFEDNTFDIEDSDDLFVDYIDNNCDADDFEAQAFS